MLLTKFNLFGPTACGYTKEAYLRLPIGWEAAPEEVFSDLFMWRKFLAHRDIRCRSRPAFTNLHPSAVLHRGLSLRDRSAINRRWLEIISDPTNLTKLKERLGNYATAQRPGNPYANPYVTFDPKAD